jgi:dTDP-4-amino-4,6-dideoxygalactose transaminase
LHPCHEDFPKWPSFGTEEIEAVNAVLKSGKVNYWTGEECKTFEREFADFVSTRYAISLANGTVALELAIMSLGLGAGDEIVIPSRTFVATGSSVLRCGATPVFADVDRESQNLTAETIRRVLSHRTKAIIVVHLAGWPCDMDPIMALASEHNLKVIEDCAQAQGAVYRGKPVGSIGHIAAFSFCQDKIMTTGGEGGMLVTNDWDVYLRAWSFKDHGKNFNAVNSKQNHLKFRWLHDSFGTNWRMTEMQAAIGRVALRKLPLWSDTRQKNAAMITDYCMDINGLRVTVPPPYITHAYYKYYLFIQADRLKPGIDRDWVVAAINAEGIPCFSGSCSEIYLEKAFTNAGLNPVHRLSVARELGETSLMLLVHPTLTLQHIEGTCSSVKKIMAKAVSRRLN